MAKKAEHVTLTLVIEFAGNYVENSAWEFFAAVDELDFGGTVSKASLVVPARGAKTVDLLKE